MIPDVMLNFSGGRFSVTYHVNGSEQEVRKLADDICIEQTIEFPVDLIGDDDIRSKVVGRVVSMHELTSGLWELVISYANEITGYEITQFINVIFGNISIKSGIRVNKLDLPSSLLQAFKGPRYGREGLRKMVGVSKRALLCTALKPMGLSSKQLAEQAYQFAMGGIDFIKDDHGLADQPFTRFRERVELCTSAVAKANTETGMRCQYVPSLNTRFETIVEDANFAKEQGAGGLLLAPGLLGFDVIRALAVDDGLGLPILVHPSFIGTYVISRNSGLSHYVLFGQLMRLAGADVSIYPNYGGRFSFSKTECASIMQGCEVSMGKVKPIFPSPGGGMHPDRVSEMLEFYGNEIMFLIGGALHGMGSDLTGNCRRFREQVELCSASVA